jgi:hypothetical protein
VLKSSARALEASGVMAPLAGDNWSSSHTGKLSCEVAVVAALSHIRTRARG